MIEKNKMINKKETKEEVETKDQKKTDSDKKLKKKKSKMSTQSFFLIFLVVMLALTSVFFVFTRNAFDSFLIFSSAIILFFVYIYTKKKLESYNRIKKMEHAFPDFISLMASNLRAGMTVDRALLISARKEFDPLDKEIMQVGKDILTAREVSDALKDMAKRINSDEISKTVQLIISGIRSGGNLAVILEQTANNMRERIFVKKRASSNVLMYVIFIFFAVAVGAPLLFGLSTVLVEIMAGMFADIGTETVNVNLPFTITKIEVSTTFIFYFAMLFIVVTSTLASLILGLVSKGQEKEGIKYIVPLIIFSLAVFLVSRWFLLKYFLNLFG